MANQHEAVSTHMDIVPVTAATPNDSANPTLESFQLSFVKVRDDTNQCNTLEEDHEDTPKPGKDGPHRTVEVDAAYPQANGSWVHPWLLIQRKLIGIGGRKKRDLGRNGAFSNRVREQDGRQDISGTLSSYRTTESRDFYRESWRSYPIFCYLHVKIQDSGRLEKNSPFVLGGAASSWRTTLTKGYRKATD